MDSRPFSDDELLAYFDESLSVERMVAIEKQIHASDELRRRVAAIVQRRESGAHTVSEIWRSSRLSCPSRSQLGSYLLGTLDAELNQYVEFHLRTVACRYCQANLEDLEASQQEQPEAKRRRRRFFESSAGYLRGADDD